MSEIINDKQCPFCQADNRCGINGISACWCGEVATPKELTSLVPLELKEKSCICSSCVKAYNNNAFMFQEKYSGD